MISKELLSLVLGEEILTVFEQESKYYKFLHIETHGEYINLSLDTLGRLCKEWCRDNEFILTSATYRTFGICYINNNNDGKFKGKIELEAIIKATEWVAKKLGLL